MRERTDLVVFVAINGKDKRRQRKMNMMKLEKEILT